MGMEIMMTFLEDTQQNPSKFKVWASLDLAILLPGIRPLETILMLQSTGIEASLSVTNWLEGCKC